MGLIGAFMAAGRGQNPMAIRDGRIGMLGRLTAYGEMLTKKSRDSRISGFVLV